MKYFNRNRKSKRVLRLFLPALIFLIVFSVIFTYPETIFTVYGENGGGFLKSDPNLRIGLVYGSGIVESFQTSADNGYYFGSVKEGASDAFRVFFYIKNTKAAVSHIANLAKNSAGRYYASNKSIVVGKYNIEFDKTFSDFAEAYNFIGGLSKNTFKNTFPAYINGRIVVRFGSFTSADAAKAHIAAFSSSSPAALKVAADSNKTAVVINPDADEILFQYEDGGNNLAVAGAPAGYAGLVYGQSISGLSSKNTSFMTSPAGNTYPGAFIYRIYNSGVEVINLIGLEDYVKCIIPAEISPGWHDEALKAFAVTVRTFALHSVGRHGAGGFDLCNDTHCQYFLGAKRATNRTNAAVDATRDLVATYKNKTILTTYCSSTGGATENHNDAWGGALIYPYLTSVQLPFENYADPKRYNSMWTNSVSPKELYIYLVGASPHASKFKGVINSEIARIIIDERSPSSNYIKKVTVVDINGNKVTIQNSEAVRNAFYKYANSANMDILQSSIFRSYIISSDKTAVNQDIEAGRTYIMGANGLTRSTPGDGNLYVLTASGKYSVKSYANGGDFIFDGKGWGHGVGLSQWAMQDMAELGYGYQEIVKKFYTGVTIEKITNVKE